MIGSSQNEVVKWLAEISAAALYLYSSHSVEHSFTFASFIENCNLKPAKAFLCTFDISSLSTNIPLDETIEICADALYRGHFGFHEVSEATFRELALA